MQTNSLLGVEGAAKELHVGTWNVAGIAIDSLDTFVEQLSDNYSWDVIMLQEGFRQTDGVDAGCHLLFTPGQLIGNLRCPAVLVNSRWVDQVDIRFEGSGARWVAVSFGGRMLFLSVHLPHRKSNIGDFAAVLDELRSFLAGRSEKHLIVGMDANVEVTSIVDFCHVGLAVPVRQPEPDVLERAALFHEFLAEKGLCLVNTFSDADASNCFTRTNWSGVGSFQVDFVAASLAVPCLDVGVDDLLEHSSDHRLVRASFEVPLVRRALPHKATAGRSWRPSESWPEAAGHISWEWASWDSTCEVWCRTAGCHNSKGRQPRDVCLSLLLEDHAQATTATEKRRVNKLIWRRRRQIKRMQANKRIEVFIRDGKAMASKSRNCTINWHKLFGTSDASLVLHQRYVDLYQLSNFDLETETHAKEAWIRRWQATRQTATPFIVSTLMLRKSFVKLRKGKGSPDGCTAEMFCALPDEAVSGLAAYMTNLLYTLCIPTSWTVVTASLIPKVVGAARLDHFRGIACISTARKIFGRIWMLMLPQLRFESFQTGFVSGAQAADGAFVLKRVGELSREWSCRVCVLQLDLSKAFDRVKHTAIIAALRMQGASDQCVSLLCAMLSQSRVAVRLGHVTADSVQLRRGIPQGAPESPLIFVLVTEFVLRPLLRKWRSRGSGWTMDLLWLAAICYADDVLLISSSVDDLEKMAAEVAEAFCQVGLDVSSSKCHWTSYPKLPDVQLNLSGGRLPWEAQITFVGAIFNLGGNDGAALEHRLAQANKVFYRWAPYLQFRQASVQKRVRLLCGTVFLSALWLGEVWLLTRQQARRLSSWGARLSARTVLVQRRGCEDMGQYWRRLHRVGHQWLRQLGGSLDRRRAARVHSFAGHAARNNGSMVHQALHTRPLSWWRYAQARHTSRHDGLHPKRFKVWRWESQLTAFYGEVPSPDAFENVGWLLEAQDRIAWKQSLERFLEDTCR